MSYLAEVFGYEDFPEDGPSIVYEWQVDLPRRIPGDYTSILVYKENDRYVQIQLNDRYIFEEFGAGFIKGQRRQDCSLQYISPGGKTWTYETTDEATTAWRGMVTAIRNRAMEALL